QGLTITLDLFIRLTGGPVQDRAAIDVGNPRDPDQGHGGIEFVAYDFDGARHARLAEGTETVNIGAAAHAGARAERPRPRDVLPRGDAAVEHPLERGAARGGNRGKGGDRRRRAVELGAAVIGHDQSRRSGLDRDAGVLDIENAFKDELAGPQALDPFDVLPAQTRIELLGDPFREHGDAAHAGIMPGNVAEGLALAAGDAERPCRFGGDVDQVAQPDLRRHAHAVLDVAVALADDLQIDGEHERATFGGGGAFDQGADITAILHDVELKPERLVHRAGDVFDR